MAAVEQQSEQAKAVAMYGGKDGVMDAAEEVMMKYDKDKSGKFSIAEVKAIVQDLEQKKSQVKNLKMVLVGAIFAAIVVCSVMFGLMFSANEAAKENHTGEDGTLTALNGEVVQVDLAESFTDLWDLPKVPMDVLRLIKTATLFVDVTNNPDMPDGLYESAAKISSAWKAAADTVYITTYEGYLVYINAATKSGTIKMGSATYPIYATSTKERRLEAKGSTCSDDAEYCLPKRVTSKRGRRLNGDCADCSPAGCIPVACKDKRVSFSGPVEEVL